MSVNCIVLKVKSTNRLTFAYRAEDGSEIDNATVTVVMVAKENGAQVLGQAWPLALTLVSSIPPTDVAPEVPRPNSTYTALLGTSLGVVKGQFYTIEVTMTSPKGSRYTEFLARASVSE